MSRAAQRAKQPDDRRRCSIPTTKRRKGKKCRGGFATLSRFRQREKIPLETHIAGGSALQRSREYTLIECNVASRVNWKRLFATCTVLRLFRVCRAGHLASPRISVLNFSHFAPSAPEFDENVAQLFNSDIKSTQNTRLRDSATERMTLAVRVHSSYPERHLARFRVNEHIRVPLRTFQRDFRRARRTTRKNEIKITNARRGSRNVRELKCRISVSATGESLLLSPTADPAEYGEVVRRKMQMTSRRERNIVFLLSRAFVVVSSLSSSLLTSHISAPRVGHRSRGLNSSRPSTPHTEEDRERLSGIRREFYRKVDPAIERAPCSLNC